MTCSCEGRLDDILNLLQGMRAEFNQFQVKIHRIEKELLGISNEAEEACVAIMENTTVRQILEHVEFDVEWIRKRKEEEDKKEAERRRMIEEEEDKIRSKEQEVKAEERRREEAARLEVEEEEAAVLDLWSCLPFDNVEINGSDSSDLQPYSGYCGKSREDDKAVDYLNSFEVNYQNNYERDYGDYYEDSDEANYEDYYEDSDEVYYDKNYHNGYID